MKSIQALAAELEVGIGEKASDVAAKLDRFSALLVRQVHAIRRALAETSFAGTKGTMAASFDPLVASGAVKRLQTLLEVNDPDAAAEFQALADAMAGRSDNVRLHELREAVDELDFEGALMKLKEIAEECGLGGRKKG